MSELIVLKHEYKTENGVKTVVSTSINKEIYVYVVVDDDDRRIWGIYDENTFKEKYKEYIKNPPLYSNVDYWDMYTIYKFQLNSENYESVNPEDVK